MSATSVPAAGKRTASLEARGRGHIGLIVLGSIASGLALGLVLVLAVFDGGTEAQITGSALDRARCRLLTARPRVEALHRSAAGLGASARDRRGGRRTRRSDCRSRRSRTPARRLGVAAPASCLVVWSIRGARHSLRSWSRRAAALPGPRRPAPHCGRRSLRDRRRGNLEQPPPAGGRTYLVDGHRLYLNCTGTGAPTVVLFNGLGERTPSWAWVQNGLSSSTRTCVFDRAGEGWSGAGPGPPGWPPARSRPPRAPERRKHLAALCARRALRRWHLRPRLRRPLPRAGRRRRPHRLLDAVHVRPPRLPKLLLDVASQLGHAPVARREPASAGSRSQPAPAACPLRPATPHATSPPHHASCEVTATTS